MNNIAKEKLLTRAMNLIYDLEFADFGGSMPRCIVCEGIVHNENCEIGQIEKEYEELLSHEIKFTKVFYD